MIYRAVSLCIIKRNDAMLLVQSPEREETITFRPVGGTVEHGEDSVGAVIREVKEEIDEDIVEPKPLGAIENIFSHQGQVGHEYDFVKRSWAMTTERIICPSGTASMRFGHSELQAGSEWVG